jgi:hypothetical protein
VLQWLHAEGCPWDGGTCARAAAGGHLELLRWARAHGCPWDELSCLGLAIIAGHKTASEWAAALASVSV